MKLLYILIHFALAHSPNDPMTETSSFSNNQPTIAPANSESLSSRDLRTNLKYWTSLNYSPLDIFVPNKLGLTLGYSIQDGDRVEIEFLKARFSPLISSQLGTFNDQRTSITLRRFSGRNSFNYLFGLSLIQTNLEFGHQLASKIIGAYPYGKAFEIESLGIHAGISNEWILNTKYKVPLRVDWFGVTQPFWSLKQEAPITSYLNDPPTKDTINATLSLAKWTPRFYFLKVQAGLGL